MTGPLDGRVALVTGGSGGVGAGIARGLSDAGAAVAVHYRSNAGGAAAVADAIANAGGRAVIVTGDLSNEDSVEEAFATARQALGPLDILVNNAGIYPVSPVSDMPLAEWREVIDANLTAAFLCTRAAAGQMRRHGGGAIINIASIEAVTPAFGHAHYTAAKAGLLMLSRTSALELGPDDIRVNAVSPGLIEREGIRDAWPEGVTAWEEAAPLGRMGTPADIADACVFLASDAARWITGANLPVDGGVLSTRPF